MTPDIIKALLHNKESETLDFKRDQYAFYRASNKEKAELLKDILAFANAWKTSDAYILIGVAEMTSGPSQVVGVTQHLQDADIQQFVTSKTNRPIQFLCGTVTVDGHDVDVIRVAQHQERPIFLTNDFGGLEKDVVRLRRGSSTDIAGVQEIADMGAVDAAQPLLAPTIELEVADPSTQTRFSHGVQITSILLVNPPLTPMEGAAEAGQYANLDSMLQEQVSHIRDIGTPSFLRGPSPEQLREYRERVCLLTGIGFWVRNTGTAAALDLKIEVRGGMADNLQVLDNSDFPSRPNAFPAIPKIRPINRRLPETEVKTYGDYWIASIHVGKVQPQAEIWIDDLIYFGCKDPVDLTATAILFADNLPTPIEYPLEVEIKTEERVYRPEDFERNE